MKRLLLIFTQIIFCLSVTVVEAHAQWGQTNGTEGLYVYDIAIRGTSIFAGAANLFNPNCCKGEVFLSSDNGLNWTEVSTGLAAPEIEAIVISGEDIFVGTQGEGVFLSTNSGVNWTGVSNGLEDSDVTTLVVSGTYIFAGTSDGVYITTDNGANWTAKNSGLTSFFVWSMAISGTDLYVGTDGGVFHSTDNGENWVDISIGLPGGLGWQGSIGVNGAEIYAGTSGLYRSTDNGENWTNVTEGLPNNGIFDIKFSGNNVFVLTNSGGISLSSDNGENWTLVNEGIVDSLIMTLAVTDSFLLAGSGSEGGIWRRALSEMITVTSVEDPSGSILSAFDLNQNYPNPFNPMTKIKFTIPKSGKVKLAAYNLTGEEVALLFDGIKHVGSHTVEWNAANFSSGIYFYRLQAGDFTQTKKMVLLK